MKKLIIGISVLFLLLTQSIVSQGLQKKVNQQPINIPKGQVLKSPQIKRYKPLIPLLNHTKSNNQVMAKIGGSTPSIATIWNWTFDESNPSQGWTMSGSWQVGRPTSGPTASTNVAGTNLNGVYENYANDWLISPTIALPPTSDYESAVLQFREWFELESGFDYVNVLISTDGGTNYTQLSHRDGGSGDWVQTEIDLTSYLGQTIKLAFQLTSDGSVTFNGWFIDDIGVLGQPKIAAKMLGVDLTTLNHSAFPFIYLNVNVDSVGTPLPSLDASSFKVFQDNIEQKDYFSVTPPSSGGGVRLADIVFVIDQTGSMGDEIDAVKTNMVSFLNALAGSGINYRVGFVLVGDWTSTVNSGNFYSDYSEILNSINNIFTCMIDCGGDEAEDQLEGMYQATQMNFRAGAQKVAIMITDAPAHEGDYETSWTVPTLISVLTASNLSVYPCFDVGDSRQIAQYQPIALARNSAGAYYNKTDNFNAVLNDITTAIGETYVVRYASSDRRTSAVRHLVRVEVTHRGDTESDTASYTFGAAPIVLRTPETVALGTTAWIEGTAFTIRATATDEFGPGLTSVTLYYRTTGASSFTSVPMVLSTGSLYEASIPAGSVVSPGVDYYITASDGIDISSDPREEPGTNAYQIAILPNQAPVITHIPVSLLTPGSPILIAADGVDNTNVLASMKCYYRKTGDLIYTRVDMTLAGGTSHVATIPGEVATADGVDYYITATDDFGLTTYDGRPTTPHQIKPPEGPAGQTILTGAVFLNDTIASAGTIIRTYRKSISSLSLVSIDTVVPYNSEKNYAISILLGDGGILNGDTLVLKLVGPSGEIGLEYGHPIQRFVDGVPPEFIETDLRFTERRSLTIPLVQGYNAISWNVQPSNSSIASIFGSVFEAGNVQIVLEYENESMSTPEFNFYIPALGPYNPLQETKVGKGYFVKLRRESPASSLTVQGPLMYHAIPITLNAGYNLIAYLPNSSDFVSHAMSGLPAGDLLSVYEYVNDGTGSPESEHFEAWPASAAFTKMQPGNGYFVHSLDSAQLMYTLPDIGSSGDSPSHRGSSITSSNEKPFSLPQEVFAYGLHIIYKGNLVPRGSVLCAYTKDGVLCGKAVFAADGIVGIAIRGDDPKTIAVEGPNPGEFVTLSVDGHPVPFQVKWTASGDTPLLGDITFVSTSTNSIPTELRLMQNYPNPFNPTTEIQYDLPKDVNVQLKIYNTLGQEICTLVNQDERAGSHSVTWDGKDYNGLQVPSGVYLSRFVAGNFTQVHKMVLLK